MNEGKLSPQVTITEKKNTSGRLLQAVFLCGILLMSGVATAQDSAPSFTAGATQVLSVCENSGVDSINSQATITDLDAGQMETWFVNTSPLGGTLTGFPTTATSTGGAITLAGLAYTPATGFTGVDSFILGISDGMDTAFTTIVVTVKSLPALSSTLTPPAICDNAVFSYTPASAATGATFAWRRNFVPGISNPTASGTGNPNESLSNITDYDVTTAYVYTVSAGGCSSYADVHVTVHATPRLSTPLYDTLCSGSTFSYVPSGTPSGVTFSWSRAVVTGLTPSTPSSGSGSINEVLVNTTSSDTLNAVYVFSLSTGGCTATRDVTVTIIPQPPVTTITTASPPSLCSGTQYQNFGAGIAPPAGMAYSWSAENAVVWATGNTGQYSIVNFPDTGAAQVILTISGAVAHCLIYDTFAVSVSPAVSGTYTVIYYDYQFVFEDNTQDTYQWGYDNAYTLEPTLIAGASFQSYPILSPDFIDNYYWVITLKNGCMQKTYFNAPLAVTNVNAGNTPLLKLAPNPAGDVVNITTNIPQGSVAEIIVTDITGQVLMKRPVTGNIMQLDIAGLPAGCYLVSTLQNNVKMTTARLIKNQ